MSDRNARLILCNGIKMDREYKNVYWNGNPYCFINLVNERKIAESNDYTLIKGNTISVGLPYSTVCKANYICFRNTMINNQDFYAWIDSVEYVSDNCTKITYTVDLWSTYWGYYGFNSTMIIRQHTNDDSLGLNRQAENVNLGAYELEMSIPYTFNTASLIGVVFVCTDNQSKSGDITQWGSMKGGVYNGMLYQPFYTSDVADINNFIQSYSTHPDDIQAIFMCPTWILANANSNNRYIARDTLHISPDSVGVGYKNKKMLQYPYTKVEITNNNGQSIEIGFDDFFNGDIYLQIYGVYTPTPEIVVVPSGYLDNTNQGILNTNQKITFSNFPACSWASDYFQNWWALNKAGIEYSNQSARRDNIINTASNVVSGIGGSIGTVANLLSGNIGGAIGGTISTIGNVAINQARSEYNMLDQLFYNQNSVNQATLHPNPARGQSSGGALDFAINNIKLNVNIYRQNYSSRQAIDDYFYMFGYAENTIGVPNILGRRQFNYVKVEGDLFSTVTNPMSELPQAQVPTGVIEHLNQVARRGFTVWHEHKNIGFYGLTNDIV